MHVFETEAPTCEIYIGKKNDDWLYCVFWGGGVYDQDDPEVWIEITGKLELNNISGVIQCSPP